MKIKNLAPCALLSLILILTSGTSDSPCRNGDLDPQNRQYESYCPEEGLNTNFSAVTGFSPGSTDPDDTPWYKPSSDDFPIMRTDCCAPTQLEIKDYIDLCEYSGSQRFNVRFINRLDQVTTDGTDPRLQIVPNHVILEDPTSLTGGYATFTLYFPPYFENTPHSRHPLLIFGSGWSGGLNEAIQKGQTYNADIVHAAYNVMDPLSKGVIGVSTNCGGNGSAGHGRWFLRDVAKLIDLLHTKYSGDRNRIVTMGSSRGGAMALIVAENPYEGDDDFPPYNVVGVFPRTFPVGAGTKSQMPLCLMSNYNGLYVSELGPGAGRYDFDPPPLSNPAPVLEAPMNTTDVVEADNLSADGQWVSKLEGKFVVLGFGSHDSWMGRQSYLNIDRKLSLCGIPHISIIVLTVGHNLGNSGNYTTIRSYFIAAMLSDPHFDPGTYETDLAQKGVFEKARNYYIRGDNRIDHLDDWSSLRHLADQKSLPFMATIPYKMARKVRDVMPWHEPAGIELSGTIGRKWKVIIKDDTDTEVARYSGIFGISHQAHRNNAESTLIRWGYDGLPGMDVTSYYSYQFLYEDQRGRMVDVSNFTNFMVETVPSSEEYMRLEPKTIITENQPYPSQYLVSDKMMAFGIDWCETILSHQLSPDSPPTPQ